MVLMESPAPIVQAKVYARVRCSGYRKKRDRDGNQVSCGFLLAVIEADEFVGRIELKCPHCHTEVVFE